MSAGAASTRRLVMVSMLSACGLILFVFESFLPVLPWFRPGLGNIATILALVLYGFGDALKVTVLRVVLGALILGRLFTPVFVFAITGGIASALVMEAVHRWQGKTFGPVGISVFGALAHNMVQLAVAYLFFVKSAEIFIFLPVFIATAVVTGNATGLAAAVVLERSGMFMPRGNVQTEPKT
jgi:heptaprenyl diphosphate synthase